MFSGDRSAYRIIIPPTPWYKLSIHGACSSVFRNFSAPSHIASNGFRIGLVYWQVDHLDHLSDWVVTLAQLLPSTRTGKMNLGRLTATCDIVEGFRGTLPWRGVVRRISLVIWEHIGQGVRYITASSTFGAFLKARSRSWLNPIQAFSSQGSSVDCIGGCLSDCGHRLAYAARSGQNAIRRFNHPSASSCHPCQHRYWGESPI